MGCAEDTDLNIETLSGDVEALLDIMFNSDSNSGGQGTLEESAARTSSASGATAAEVKVRRQRVILVGHSLGGAVATHLCARLRARRVDKDKPSSICGEETDGSSSGVASRRRAEIEVCGLALLDAIEGTAVEAIDAGTAFRTSLCGIPLFILLFPWLNFLLSS